MRPRILAVSHSLSYSGAPLALHRLIAGLGDRYDFDLVVPPGATAQPLAADYRALGIPVVDDVDAAAYDLILANTIASALPVIHGSRGAPAVWWIHEDRAGLELLHRQPQLGQAFAAAAAIVFPSRHLRDDVYRPWVGSRPDAVRIIANAVEPAAAAAPAAPGPGRPTRIVQIGYEDRIKGQDLTVAALRLLDADVQVDFVGRRATPAARIADDGLAERLTWHGELPPDRARAIVAAADIVCQPSREETQSLAILEAMAFGKPVVASDLPGIRDAVDDGETGLLVPVGDPRALATAIDRLHRDPALGAALGRRGREAVAARFSPAAQTTAFAALFDQLIANRRRS